MAETAGLLRNVQALRALAAYLVVRSHAQPPSNHYLRRRFLGPDDRRGDREAGADRRAPRVLIYRLGGIGDTLVALPALKLVRRAFPGARFALLTTRSAVPEASMPGLLRGTGLADTVIEYARCERRPLELLGIHRRIRAFDPDVLVYLAEPRGLYGVWRDWLFFRLCGIRRIVGAPLLHDLVRHRRCPEESGLWEREAARLARTIAVLGDARLDDPASWDPELLPDEVAEAERRLAAWEGADNFIAACVGASTPARDWGEANWAAVLERLGACAPSLGLMLIGGPAQGERSRRLAALWPGPALVSVDPSPRVNMAMLRRARMFVGLDGGPLHMAAATGRPAVAVFAGISPAGVWYPGNGRHDVLIHRTPCMGCRLTLCVEHANACLTAIGVERVLDACTAMLSATPPLLPARS